MRRLYRSAHDRILGGVCGGLGAYLGVDPNLIRLAFVLLALFSGAGVILYLVLWLILPVEGGVYPPRAAAELAGRARELGEEMRRAARVAIPRSGVIVGLGLVALGVLLLLRNLGVLWAPWLKFEVLWPALLILGGLALLTRGLW